MKFFALNKKIAHLESLLSDMEERLMEHQATVEVMADALEQKDVALGDFILELHEGMGGEVVPKNKGATLERLRQIRDGYDRYTAIREVMAGMYSMEAGFLKRLACALGCAQWDVETILGRAGILSGAHVKNAELYRELTLEKQKVRELEDELDPDV